MNILFFIKKLFSSSNPDDEECARKDIELANMNVEQNEFELVEDSKSISIFEDNVEPKTIIFSPSSQSAKKDTLPDLIIKDETICVNEYGSETTQVSVQELKNGKGESLLDNKSYMSLVDSLSTMIMEIEEATDISSPELVEIIKSRLQEGMVISGAELISEDKSFNPIRHIPIPAAMIKQGTPIESFIEPGIMVEGKVIRKAKVIIKKQV